MLSCHLQVTIGAINLVDAIFWTFHIFQSQYVTVDGTQINNDQLIGNSAPAAQLARACCC